MYVHHKGGGGGFHYTQLVGKSIYLYHELTQISIYTSIPEAAPGEELGGQMWVAYHYHTHSHHLEGVDQAEPSEKQTLFKAHHLRLPTKKRNPLHLIVSKTYLPASPKHSI